MSLLPLYSRRKREAEASGVDVFEYDQIPRKVRVQIHMNLTGGLLVIKHPRWSAEHIITEMVKELREEMGTHSLAPRARTPAEEFETWFLDLASTDEVLDAIELWHLVASTIAKETYSGKEEFAFYVRRLNARLLEAGVGYELVDGKIIKKANQYLHGEVILPALHVLNDAKFAGANKEFRDAHEAFRNGEYEDCLTDCLKALESVIKVIASERSWDVQANATAKHLIAALFDHELVPQYMQSQFIALRSVLESSVPVTRNKSSGHGRGTEQRQIPASLAAFQLHQTAAIIVFLAELDR